ncbi:hypothetical protein V8D89_003166 [Ganoderma adspersum]
MWCFCSPLALRHLLWIATGWLILVDGVVRGHPPGPSNGGEPYTSSSLQPIGCDLSAPRPDGSHCTLEIEE